MQEDDDNIIITAKLLDNNLSSKWCKLAKLLGSWLFTATVGIWGLQLPYGVTENRNTSTMRCVQDIQ